MSIVIYILVNRTLIAVLRVIRQQSASAIAKRREKQVTADVRLKSVSLVVKRCLVQGMGNRLWVLMVYITLIVVSMLMVVVLIVMNAKMLLNLVVKSCSQHTVEVHIATQALFVVCLGGVLVVTK